MKLFSFFSFFLIIQKAFFQIVVGPNNPGSFSNVSCSFAYGSLTQYLPVANVALSDNLYANVSHCACCDMNTQCIYARNFGFSLPAGAIIKGIKVDIEKNAQLGSNVQDNGIRLSKAGIEVGNNYMNSSSWPAIDTYVSYGGCNDLWGTTWTASDINDPNFGVYFASIDYTCMGNIISSIDHIRMSICYDLPLNLPNINMYVYPSLDRAKVLLKRKNIIEPADANKKIKLLVQHQNEIPEILYFSDFKTDSLILYYTFSKKGKYIFILKLTYEDNTEIEITRENYEYFGRKITYLLKENVLYFFDEDINYVEVLDIFGRVVCQNNFLSSDKIKVITVPDTAKGIYMLRVMLNNGKEKIEKIII
jgi:hypothetical protein